MERRSTWLNSKALALLFDYNKAKAVVNVGLARQVEPITPYLAFLDHTQRAIQCRNFFDFDGNSSSLFEKNKCAPKRNKHLCFIHSSWLVCRSSSIIMVLTSPEIRSPPSRGTTLPNQFAFSRQSNVDLEKPRPERANTLPNRARSMTVSAIDLNNLINNNPAIMITARKSPHSVSIMSLPNSDDNEGFTFDNRYSVGRQPYSQLIKFMINVFFFFQCPSTH